jgi:hypothetical protein
MDLETEEAMQGLSMLGKVFGGKVPVVARASGARNFKFIADLERAKLRVDLDELEGEVTFFAKIQRKLRPSEEYTMLDSISGLMSALPREERRKATKSLKNDTAFPDMVVGAPAAIAAPVAIYR